MATRHECMLRFASAVPSLHTSGSGKGTRKRCAHCGGNIFTVTGRYGVFVHTSFREARFGDYRADDAILWRQSEGAAQRYVDMLNRGDARMPYVVRFTSDEV